MQELSAGAVLECRVEHALDVHSRLRVEGPLPFLGALGQRRRRVVHGREAGAVVGVGQASSGVRLDGGGVEVDRVRPSERQDQRGRVGSSARRCDRHALRGRALGQVRGDDVLPRPVEGKGRGSAAVGCSGDHVIRILGGGRDRPPGLESLAGGVLHGDLHDGLGLEGIALLIGLVLGRGEALSRRGEVSCRRVHRDHVVVLVQGQRRHSLGVGVGGDGGVPDRTDQEPGCGSRGRDRDLEHGACVQRERLGVLLAGDGLELLRGWCVVSRRSIARDGPAPFGQGQRDLSAAVGLLGDRGQSCGCCRDGPAGCHRGRSHGDGHLSLLVEIERVGVVLARQRGQGVVGSRDVAGRGVAADDVGRARHQRQRGGAVGRLRGHRGSSRCGGRGDRPAVLVAQAAVVHDGDLHGRLVEDREVLGVHPTGCGGERRGFGAHALACRIVHGYGVVGDLEDDLRASVLSGDLGDHFALPLVGGAGDRPPGLVRPAAHHCELWSLVAAHVQIRGCVLDRDARARGAEREVRLRQGHGVGLALLH